MKIFTNKRFQEELEKARCEIEERYFRRDEMNRLNERVCKLENRVSELEGKKNDLTVEGFAR